MTAAANPIHAFVAFLRIPQFESRSVIDQAALKQGLELHAKTVLSGLASGERLVLDADDGLAVVLFGDAARALEVAQSLHEAPATLPIQAGLGYGPLALTSRGAEARVFGDGLSAAAAASRFAPENKLLVTENFARALQASAPARAADLADAGEFTDTRVRMHAFYTPDKRLGVHRRRRFALYTGAGVVAILLLGVIGRDIYQPLFQARPAILTLQVKPRAEVIVDGITRGRTPPLTEIEVAPGKRRLQMRAAGSPPLELTVDLKPGQKMTITHTFVRTPEPKPDLWRDLKKKFGS